MIALSDGRIHAIKYTVAHQNRFKAEVTYQLILAKIQMPFNKEIPEKEQADYKGIYVRSRQESSRHQHQMLRSNSRSSNPGLLFELYLSLLTKSSNIQDKEGGCTGWLFPRPRKESTLLNIHKKD